MKARIFMLFAIFLILAVEIIPQEKGISFWGRFNLGYSAFDLTAIKNIYDESLKGYDLVYNIPVKTQKKFPANGIYEASIFADFNDNFRISIGYSAFNTKAYSLYGDYAGELDVIGEIKAAAFYIGGAKMLPNIYFIRPYVEANIGYISGSYALESAIRMPQVEVNQTEKLDFDGNGWFLEPAIGLLSKIYFAEIHIKAGYRYAVIDDLSGEYRNSFSQYYPVSTDRLKIDMSGFFIMSGVSIAF